MIPSEKSMEENKKYKKAHQQADQSAHKKTHKNWHIPKLKVWVRVLFYVLTIIMSTISLVSVITERIPLIISYGVYVLAACTLFISCFYFVSDIKNLYRLIIKPLINGTPILFKLTSEYKFRTYFTTIFSFTINILYAGLNGIYGIVYSSWWFGTLSAYYIVLSSLRCSALKRAQKNRKGGEDAVGKWKHFRFCGIWIILLDIALMGSVILVVVSDYGKSYQDIFVIAVAAYTFYKITMTIMNLIRVRSSNDPGLMSVRCIGLADTLMSILSLQTAMFASFGDGTDMKIWMNAITGAVICIMILIMGIYMIIKGQNEMNQINNQPEAN